MDASDSEISPVTSSSFLLITGLTILSALFITTLAVNHELHDPARTGKMILFARWMLIVIPIGLFVSLRTWKHPFDHLSLLVLIWGGWILLCGKHGGFLLGSLPVALLLTSIRDHHFYRKFISYTGWFAAALILVIIPSTQSRAAYLGTLTVLGVWILFRYKPLVLLKIILNTKQKKLLAGIFVPVVFAMLFTGFYWLKKDSADERLLIWKVAMQTVKEKPLTGHGFNTIQATLAPAQAAYFDSGKGSESEKMLAGSVRWVKEIKFPSRAIEEMKVELKQIISDNDTKSINIKKVKGKNYKYEDQIGFKLQFW